MTAPLLSVCMIVRNEAAFLPGALCSLRAELGDVEIVLVDTGSTDDTAAIAERYGCKVVNFAWRDDFAAARNASLDAASGRWALIFDADHRLAPGSGRAILSFVADMGHTPTAVRIPTHEAIALDDAPRNVASGARRQSDPWIPVVLFPRVIGGEVARYRRRIHEHPTEWLHAHGCRELLLDEAAIVHYGGIGALRESAGRNDRNRRLLEECLEADPDDLESAAYLAFDHYQLGRIDESLAVIDAALGRQAKPQHRWQVAKMLRTKALCLHERGDAWGVLTACSLAEQVGRKCADVDALAGLAYEALGRHALALSAFSAAHAHRGDEGPNAMLRGASTWLSLWGIGRCLATLGETEGAEAQMVAALECGDAAMTDAIRADIEGDLGRVREVRYAKAA